MFTNSDISYLKQSSYKIKQVNYHDATLHSTVTGHDWIIVSSYGAESCYILHRHSGKDPYHRQEENYKSLLEALEYIDHHEAWFAAHKMKTINRV